MTAFDWLAANEPPYSDDDTAIDEVTKEIVTLPTLPDDPTPTVTLTDGKLIVARVRIGSIVHRLMLAKGYRVVKS